MPQAVTSVDNIKRHLRKVHYSGVIYVKGYLWKRDKRANREEKRSQTSTHMHACARTHTSTGSTNAQTQVGHMYVPSKRNRDYIKLQLPPQLKQCKYAGTYRCMDARTHVRTYIRTYLCLFRSKDCSLQGNTDHVHTEVNGVHHCTILLGLQGVGGGASERHALSYTWRESHTHCSAPFCPSPFSR